MIALLQNRANSQNKWVHNAFDWFFCCWKFLNFLHLLITIDMEWQATDVLIGHNLAFYILHFELYTIYCEAFIWPYMVNFVEYWIKWMHYETIAQLIEFPIIWSHLAFYLVALSMNWIWADTYFGWFDEFSFAAEYRLYTIYIQWQMNEDNV